MCLTNSAASRKVTYLKAQNFEILSKNDKNMHIHEKIVFDKISNSCAKRN